VVVDVGGVGIGLGVGGGATVVVPLPVTEFDGDDAGPMPYLLLALTVNEYLFEFFASLRVHDVVDDLQVMPAGCDTAR
jgi:hypothetical protein